MADWPFKEARAALRMADVLAGKPADYWSRTGRERVERELAEDGLSPERIDAVIVTIEGGNVPEDHISLAAVLADLMAREGGP